MTDGTSQLFALAEADDADGLLKVLSERTNPTPPVNENGETLYLFCTYRGRTRCADVLTNRGGLTLHEAAAAGDVRRMEECATGVPWMLQTLSGDGWTALHLAAFLGRGDAVLWLLDHRADARQWSRAADANLAIHAACAGRRLAKAAFSRLVAATHDPDIAQKAGYTPLMIAAANGFVDAVEVLLAAGADRGKKNLDGKTAADFARERGHPEIAAKIGDL